MKPDPTSREDIAFCTLSGEDLNKLSREHVIPTWLEGATGGPRNLRGQEAPQNWKSRFLSPHTSRMTLPANEGINNLLGGTIEKWAQATLAQISRWNIPSPPELEAFIDWLELLAIKWHLYHVHNDIGVPNLTLFFSSALAAISKMDLLLTIRRTQSYTLGIYIGVGTLGRYLLPNTISIGINEITFNLIAAPGLVSFVRGMQPYLATANQGAAGLISRLAQDSVVILRDRNCNAIDLRDVPAYGWAWPKAPRLLQVLPGGRIGPNMWTQPVVPVAGMAYLNERDAHQRALAELAEWQVYLTRTKAFAHMIKAARIDGDISFLAETQRVAESDARGIRQLISGSRDEWERRFAWAVHGETPAGKPNPDSAKALNHRVDRSFLGL